MYEEVGGGALLALLRFTLWTGMAIALGVLLATVEVNGRTPVQHLHKAWQSHVTAESFTRMKKSVERLVDDAKDAVSAEEPYAPKAPRERYSPQERADLNRLIANRASAQ